MTNNLTAFIQRATGDSSEYWFELWIADGYESISAEQLSRVCLTPATRNSIESLSPGEHLKVEVRISTE